MRRLAASRAAASSRSQARRRSNSQEGGTTTASGRPTSRWSLSRSAIAVRLSAVSDDGRRVQTTRRSNSGLTRIALLTANPDDRDGLKTAMEHRAIRAVLRSSRYRDEFELRVRSAARPSDLLEALCEDRAAILHFSGHGAGDGIALEDSAGLTTVFPADALREAIATAGALRVVVLAACSSAEAAAALVDTVDCAIGVEGAITDAGMHAFAEAFYRAIFAGLTVANAFRQGQAAATAASPPAGERLRLHQRAASSANLAFCGIAARRLRRRTQTRARPTSVTGDAALLARVK